MKVAVIGAGVMGKNHARVLSTLDSLAGVVDADFELAKRVASKYRVEAAKDISDLDFDAAVIATPTVTHYELAKKVITMGKHVLVEKPFTHDLDKAQELIDLAKDMDVILAVGHIERFNPIVEFFKNMNSKNLITINAKRVSGFPTRIRDVGVILDLGVHDIDVFRYIVGEIVEVYARGGKIKHDKYEDHASMLFTFKNGRHGYIEINWLTPKKIRKLWLTYTDKYAEGDYIEQWVEVSSGKLEYDEFNTFNIQVDLNIRRINLKKEEPLKRELANFINAIENSTKPLVTGEDGLAAVKVAKAALQSLEKDKPVEIE